MIGTTCKINALASYFGCKRTMSRDIVIELGPHKYYLEAFLGGCSILFAKPVSRIEIVNDLYGWLINVAMCVASDRWTELYGKVNRVLQSESLIEEWQQALEEDIVPPRVPSEVTDSHIELAARYLAVSWIGRNGISGTKRTEYQIAVRYTQKGGGPGTRWRSVIDSLPAWHDRLKAVTILRRDGFGLIESVADEEGTALYVDPPYFKDSLAGGTEYFYGFNELDHDSLFGKCDDDHDRLAELLRRFRKARVVLSYYDHPRLDDLYVSHGWTKLDMARNKNLSVQHEQGATPRVAPEVLLLNGRSYQ